MGKYNPKNLSDYVPETALDKGWYIWKVVNVKEDQSKSGNAMLFVDVVCQEGQEQSNGKSPLNHEATVLLMLEYEGMKEKGKRMMQKRLGDFITACGYSTKKAFDWDDLIEKEFEGFGKPEEYEGEMRTVIDKYRSLEEEEVED